MSDDDVRKRIHELDVTVWVGKSGLDPVVEELQNQLSNTDLVKVKFLRSARGGSDVDELADDLAERADAECFETRGNTAVMRR